MKRVWFHSADAEAMHSQCRSLSCSVLLTAFYFSKVEPPVKWIAEGEAEDTKISWWIVLTDLLEVLQVTDHPKLILSAISEGFVSCIIPFQKKLATHGSSPFEMELNQIDKF